MTRTEDANSAVISHPAHPQHRLQLAAAGKFKCDGCMQYGHGQSYRCNGCDYDVHTCCVPPETSLVHPRFNGYELDFLFKPPAGPGRICNACGDAVLGFLYHNGDVDLHPACAKNPERVDIDGVLFDLHTEIDTDHVCARCNKKGNRSYYWSYRARDDNGALVYQHLACIINDIGASKDQSTSTKLLNAPGETTWYRKAWKFTKIIAKLAYYLLSFDPTNVVAMAGEAVDTFS